MGGGPPPGMGGPPPGGAPGPLQPATQIKPLSAWEVIEKILDGKKIETKKQKPSGQNNQDGVENGQPPIPPPEPSQPPQPAPAMGAAPGGAPPPQAPPMM
jgi:hypothetical protein